MLYRICPIYYINTLSITCYGNSYMYIYFCMYAESCSLRLVVLFATLVVLIQYFLFKKKLSKKYRKSPGVFKCWCPS